MLDGDFFLGAQKTDDPKDGIQFGVALWVSEALK
jgi:hypothetical protein